jgi:hypothetical protein
MKYILTTLLILGLYSNSYSTETYYINEIKPQIIRAVFSDQNVTDHINNLSKMEYKWTNEMVNAGSSEISYYQFAIFFEKKNSPTLVLIFIYDQVNKKIINLELMKDEAYKKRLGY